MRKTLEVVVEKEAQPLEDKMKERLIDIVRECQAQLIHLYQTTQAPEVTTAELEPAMLPPKIIPTKRPSVSQSKLADTSRNFSAPSFSSSAPTASSGMELMSTGAFVEPSMASTQGLHFNSPEHAYQAAPMHNSPDAHLHLASSQHNSPNAFPNSASQHNSPDSVFHTSPHHSPPDGHFHSTWPVGTYQHQHMNMYDAIPSSYDTVAHSNFYTSGTLTAPLMPFADATTIFPQPSMAQHNYTGAGAGPGNVNASVYYGAPVSDYDGFGAASAYDATWAYAPPASSSAGGAPVATAHHQDLLVTEPGV